MLLPGPTPMVGSALAPGSVPAATDAVLLPAADDGVEMVARFFRALADPARLRLLEFLMPGERTVTECVAYVGLSQGRVSAHLACLAGCGYVQARRAGRCAFYRVANPRVADLVALARSMAADNAAALAACVYVDTPARKPAEWSRNTHGTERFR
jgi:ArsR family transcriptional regulator, cadmium/lead-responsive transcriptional repressor